MPESTQISNFDPPTVKEVAKAMTPAQRKAAIKLLQKRKNIRDMKRQQEQSTVKSHKGSA